MMGERSRAIRKAPATEHLGVLDTAANAWRKTLGACRSNLQRLKGRQGSTKPPKTTEQASGAKTLPASRSSSAGAVASSSVAGRMFSRSSTATSGSASIGANNSKPSSFVTPTGSQLVPGSSSISSTVLQGRSSSPAVTASRIEAEFSLVTKQGSSSSSVVINSSSVSKPAPATCMTVSPPGSPNARMQGSPKSAVPGRLLLPPHWLQGSMASPRRTTVPTPAAAARQQQMLSLAAAAAAAHLAASSSPVATNKTASSFDRATVVPAPGSSPCNSAACATAVMPPTPTPLAVNGRAEASCHSPKGTGTAAAAAAEATVAAAVGPVTALAAAGTELSNVGPVPAPERPVAMALQLVVPSPPTPDQDSDSSQAISPCKAAVRGAAALALAALEACMEPSTAASSFASPQVPAAAAAAGGGATPTAALQAAEGGDGGKVEAADAGDEVTNTPASGPQTPSSGGQGGCHPSPAAAVAATPKRGKRPRFRTLADVGSLEAVEVEEEGGADRVDKAITEKAFRGRRLHAWLNEALLERRAQGHLVTPESVMFYVLRPPKRKQTLWQRVATAVVGPFQHRKAKRQQRKFVKQQQQLAASARVISRPAH